jgi:hypothetical protein
MESPVDTYYRNPNWVPHITKQVEQNCIIKACASQTMANGGSGIHHPPQTRTLGSIYHEEVWLTLVGGNPETWAKYKVDVGTKKAKKNKAFLYGGERSNTWQHTL